MGRFLAQVPTRVIGPASRGYMDDSTAEQLYQLHRFYMGDNNQRKRAIELLREGVFPSDWAMVPVAGKSTYVKGWTKIALDRDKLELEYKMNSAYKGLGVVTGGFSSGLIALDIDGPSADERYKELAGDEYRPFGEEGTWTVTSNREGRRQIFYRVPTSMVAELTHVKKVIRRVDGSWHLGAGDPLNKDQLEQQKEDAKYEELVLRYNNCQSVLPGSPHPITKKQYWFANDCREVAVTPSWIIDVLMQYREPVGFLNNAALAAIREDLDAVKGDTKNSTNQMRGWFFNTSGAHKKLIDEQKLEELVFTPERFPMGFDWKDKGDGVHRQNYCPWHGGESGTSFQYNAETGCWFCMAEGVGGDVVDFIHKSRVDDIQAPRPIGMDLEIILRELAEGLGIDFETINTQKTQEQLGMRCSPQELLDNAAKIIKEVRDPALRTLQLQNLITTSNLYGYKPKQLIHLVRTQQRYKQNGQNGILRKRGWSHEVSTVEAVIPGLIQTCRQYMIHARGGVGKSQMCLSMAKLIGNGGSMKVRGMSMKAQQGKVLWVSNDQGAGQLKQMMFEQGLTEENATWLHMVDNWMSDQHDDLVDVIKKVQPKLIVMDSLSTVIEGDENRGDYADYIYEMSKCNGDPTRQGGFEGCAVIWIHHNRKDNTDFRGSDRLQNAVDEAWSLRAMTEEEEAEHGFDKRICTVGKSRMGRSGDRLMVSMDKEYNLSIEDMTPTVTRRGSQHQGDYREDGLVLKILAEAEGPLDRKELQALLHVEQRSQGASKKELVSDWGLRKFIARWIEQQLIEEQDYHPGGKGRPRKVYVSRGVREKDLSFINLDDPLTWPREAFEWISGAHSKWVDTPQETSLTNNSPEAGRVTDAEAPLNVGSQNQSFDEDQPEKEMVVVLTGFEETDNLRESSLPLVGGSEADTTDGLTHEVDATDSGMEVGFD